jgi:amino acid adenylation domain-containing protein
LNQKDELFAYLLEREGFERQSEYTIPRRDNGDNPPSLSFAQERFWFLDQFEHARPVYNGCKVERLVGDLNVAVLVKSLDLIMHRHEVLRTTYPAPDGKPIQRIAANGAVTLAVEHLEHIGTAALPGVIERLVRNEWLQPIDLAEQLPIRARLARIDRAQHLLILTLHQIVFDSQSVAIFFGELWSAYETIQNGKEPQLAALPVQYADFANWQRQRVSGETFQSHRAYWVQRLSGVFPVLNLPTDKPRPPAQGFDGSRLPLLLPETLQLKLKALSRANGVSLFVTLLAAFKTLLYRYTAQEDLIVGCPVLNRQLPEVEDLLGSFVNTVVLRTSYSGSPTFRETLYRVRETCVDAFAHQDFPFEQLVEELQPQRDVARNPIFQVMFAFQNTSVPALEIATLRSETVDVDGGMTKFDLTFSLMDKKHGIAGHIEYSTDLFHRATIEGMVRHFQVLLESITDDPDQAIATLPIMAEPERRQIIRAWNDSVEDYPKEKCIHELFEAQAERTPEAIALEYQDQRITYRELDRKANQLAHYLVHLGIGREKRVGICIERSIEMVVGLMGILKAGGAYVPLDPAYPKERLRFTLEDAQVAVLLTHEKLVDDRGWRMEDGDPPSSILDPRLQVVFVDRDLPMIEQQSDENPIIQIDSHNLAYVIYTSGSTGLPKGVQIAHRSLVNCVWCMQQQFGLTAEDKWLALTTLGFDITGLEIFLPLITGARVVLAAREEVLDGKMLARRLRQGGVTVMQATPSAWKLLLDAGWRGDEGLKILCGGEVLSRPLADQLLEGGASLWNLYGPTETTIWSTMAKVQAGAGPVSLGRPIANSQTYILDSRLQPVPVGVHGELYIGGAGLARDYLNRPQLTAEKFLPNPFGGAGSRLYRTGDLARYLPDGSIEFLGRADQQVKIRGYRIELGEIESALNQHPVVRECVIVARARDSLFEQSLIGYVVPSQQPAPSVADLRGYLREKLPDYMIPSVFIPLDELPLTPNGKLDRSALPLPDGERLLLDPDFVEPRTEIEELVAQIWREVLKFDKIGIHDNFFDVGGHSLLATRVAARLRTGFDIDLPLRKLFELPTVAGLAEHIEILRRSEKAVFVPPILPVSRDREIPLSFSQQRLWFLRELDPGSTAYNIPSIFTIHGPLNVPVLEQAINAVIVRHEILRTVFAEKKDGNPVQVILPFLEIAIRVIDLGDTPAPSREAKAHELALAEVRQPFDLRAGPLLRANILALAEQDFYFLLNADHMILDGTSMAVFFKEIAAGYEAVLDGHACALSPLAVQYADYAVWEREGIPAESLNAQLDYWKGQFDSWLPQPELPANHGRPPLQTWRGGRLTKTLSRELTAGLKDLSRREGVTLFMTLLAAFDIMVSGYTGSEDIVVGSTIAGRTRPEIENLIGFFINALPLRVDVAGNPSFTELLKRVREVCLDAYTHQDLPFEKIVEAVNPQRNLNRNPLFQVLFNVADVSDRVLLLHGCEVSRRPFVDRDAKFDLTLYAPEKDGAIELAIVYNVDLFNTERVTAMLDQYAFLLTQIVTAPEKSIAKYDLLTPAAEAVLPRPDAPLGSDWMGAIHDMFSQNADKTPDRLAVSDALGDWTYTELEGASNQLARCLIANGIKPKDRVAIYAQRTASLVVALMGVLKASGVFTILDPAYPASRLMSYLHIARPKGWLQLDGSELSKELSSGLETLGIESRLRLPRGKNDLARKLQEFSVLKPAILVQPNDPAYIAFTSGSTGEPKGIVSRHGPITHFLPWQTKAFDLRENDRFALLSGLAYNHLHRDVFTPIAMGAALYVPPPEIVKEPELLCEWLRANSITVLHLTPALGELLLTVGENTLPAVRRIFFGGDVLTQGQVAKIRAVAPNATIGCFYGATETQRAVGYYEISQDFTTSDADANRPIPLGHGIEDVQLLVLNKHGKLAGIGELGELCIRSPHLADGYVNDETRTREVFITNPFTNDPEDRLYRTDELARYLPDGNVEWAGRNDRRVNIRGFRVELEEVESVLKQHPIVKSAAVVMQDYQISSPENPKPETRNPKRDQRLVAYVTAEESQQSLADLLHGYLSSRLPDYMVPTYFVILEQLPLSPNGKVDYRALPAVQQFLSAESSLIEGPRNDVEAKLSTIFSKVLSREQVGVEENFFRVGGHSLLAAQAAARVREAFGVVLELRTFLESPTIAALAKEIEVRLKPADTTPGTEDTDREEIEL